MPRGRPPKKNKDLQENQSANSVSKRSVGSAKDKYTCFYCGNEYVDTNYYKSNSIFYEGICRIPYCKQCIEKLYQYFYEKYTNDGCLIPEKKAVQRLCMVFDIYYRDDVFDSSMNKIKTSGMNITAMSQYMKQIQLQQYNRNKESYENTIYEAEQENFAMAVISNMSGETTVEQKTIDFFGSGFTDEDYKYLKREYGVKG